MEAKKPSKVQLENRIKKAVLMIDKTADTKSIFFHDRDLKITITDAWAVIGCGAYYITFSRITPNGFSRQYIYLSRLVAAALEHKEAFTIRQDGEERYSYAKFLEHIKVVDEDAHLIAWYVDKWIYNYECQLSSLGESVAQTFVTYEQFMHNVAVNAVILSEKKEDMTNKQFLEEVIKHLNEYKDDIETEQVIYPKRTDDEALQEEIEALKEVQNQEMFEGNGE